MCSLPECWGEGKLCEAGISTWAHKNVASFVASKSEAKNTATTYSTFVAQIFEKDPLPFTIVHQNKFKKKLQNFTLYFCNAE